MTKRYHRERDRHVQGIASQRVANRKGLRETKGTYRETGRTNLHRRKGKVEVGNTEKLSDREGVQMKKRRQLKRQRGR